MSQAAQLGVVAVHAGATWIMVGVILVIQLVHYPLFAGVGREGFVAYETDHTRRITWIVLPTMLVELVSAAALVWAPPEGIGPASTWLGAGLLGVIWASTAWLQVPMHTRLGQGFDERAHRWLVQSNWIRTVAWCARGGLAMAWLTTV